MDTNQVFGELYTIALISDNLKLLKNFRYQKRGQEKYEFFKNEIEEFMEKYAEITHTYNISPDRFAWILSDNMSRMKEIRNLFNLHLKNKERA